MIAEQSFPLWQRGIKGDFFGDVKAIARKSPLTPLFQRGENGCSELNKASLTIGSEKGKKLCKSA
jgi:hypothetical protein